MRNTVYDTLFQSCVHKHASWSPGSLFDTKGSQECVNISRQIILSRALPTPGFGMLCWLAVHCRSLQTESTVVQLIEQKLAYVLMHMRLNCCWFSFCSLVTPSL